MLVRATPFQTLAIPSLSPDGHEIVIAVVKATFVRSKTKEPVRAAKQEPVRAGDIVHFPDATESSIRYPSDGCPAKHGADVIVVGDALSPKPVAVLDLMVVVRDLKVPLRVHGERVYYKGLSSVSISPAAAFERKPVIYERAYGGASPDLRRIETRNPVGRGVAADPRELDGTPAPQIEHPGHPITSAADRPEPVGFGAIGPGWSPRRELAGTFDERWKKERMPLMPVDFDVRSNNCAHPSLQLPKPLAGGDLVQVLGMTLDGLWQVTLPEVPVVVRALYDGRPPQVERPRCDTLLVEPEQDRFQMTFRTALRMGRGKSVLREIRVDVE